MSGLVLSLLQSQYIIQRTIFLILIFTYSCSYTDTIPYKHFTDTGCSRYRYRVYQIHIQTVQDTDTGCIRYRYRVYPIQIQGVPDTDTECTRYRYRVYQIQIQGVPDKDTSYSIDTDTGCIRYRYRVYQIQIQGVSDTDTGCTRYRYRLFKIQIQGVSDTDTGCIRYRYRVYQIKIQGVPDTRLLTINTTSNPRTSRVSRLYQNPSWRISKPQQVSDIFLYYLTKGKQQTVKSFTSERSTPLT